MLHVCSTHILALPHKHQNIYSSIYLVTLSHRTLALKNSIFITLGIPYSKQFHSEICFKKMVVGWKGHIYNQSSALMPTTTKNPTQLQPLPKANCKNLSLLASCMSRYIRSLEEHFLDSNLNRDMNSFKDYRCIASIPVCRLWCRFSWSERENLRSQSLKSHWYGFSPAKYQQFMWKCGQTGKCAS